MIIKNILGVVNIILENGKQLIYLDIKISNLINKLYITPYAYANLMFTKVRIISKNPKITIGPINMPISIPDIKNENETVLNVISTIGIINRFAAKLALIVSNKYFFTLLSC